LAVSDYQRVSALGGGGDRVVGVGPGISVRAGGGDRVIGVGPGISVRPADRDGARQGLGGRGGQAPLPQLPPGAFDVRLRLPDFPTVVQLIDGSRLVGQLFQVEAVVCLHHDLESFFYRGSAVEVFDGAFRSLRGGDVGAALQVVPRDVHFVAGQAIPQIEHPLFRVVRVLALRVLLDHGSEGAERFTRGTRRALGEINVEEFFEGVRLAFEIYEAFHVPRIVDARMGRVLANECLSRIGGRLTLTGAVVCVDQIQAGLARLVGKREAGGELLVLLDRGLEVVGNQALVCFFIKQFRAGFGQILAMGAAGGCKQDHAHRDDTTAYKLTGQGQQMRTFLWLRAVSNDGV